jgi:hypothetical protein
MTLSLKNDVNVPSKRNKRCWRLKGQGRKQHDQEPDPDPLGQRQGSEDPDPWHTKKSWIHNTDYETPDFRQVAGDVYAVDETTLLVKNFVYDGNGKDTFFWAGSSNR